MRRPSFPRICSVSRLVSAGNHAISCRGVLLPALLMVLVNVLCGCSLWPGSASAAFRPFTFVQIADPQFGMYMVMKEEPGYDREIRDCDLAVRQIEALRPEFIAVTGDFVNTWNDAEQLELFRAHHEALGRIAPVYLAVGNHDMPPTAEARTMVRSRYGEDYFAVTHRQCRLIFLNSNLIFYAEKLPEEEQAQWNWLVAELEAARRDGARRIFIFQHHTWFVRDPGEKDDYFNIPSARRLTYLDLFADHGVDAVFTGHYHRECMQWYRDVLLISTSSLGKPLGQHPPGFRVVTVHADGLEEHFIPVTPQ